MKLQRVTFLGLRGLADASYSFLHPASDEPHDLVVLTGPAASGKTRALEAIAAAKEALGPYGPPAAGAPWISPGSIVAKVVLTFRLDDEEQGYAGASSPVLEGEATFLPERARGEADEGLVALLQRYTHGETGKLEYFASNRRAPAHAPYHGLGVHEQRLLRAGKDPRKFGFLPRFLQKLETDPARATAFAGRLSALSPTCRYEPSGESGGLPRCFSSRGGTPVFATELSDGEADAVLFAATAVAIHLSRSIVLIDRPELFAGAGDLPGFVSGLRALGEDNQLVMASSSPELLAAAGPALICSLEQGDPA